MRLPFGPRHMRPGTIPRTPSLPFILACVSHLSSTACLPRRRQLLPAAFGRQQLCGATINGYLVPELNGFKVDIDTMRIDGADHPLHDHQLLLLARPMRAVLTLWPVGPCARLVSGLAGCLC